MILNIRGPSRSGKTTIMERLLDYYPSVDVIEQVGWHKKKSQTVGHLLPGGLFLVGPYNMTARTSGIDALSSVGAETLTLWLERNCQRYPHVIFESTAISTVIERYHQLSQRMGGIDFAFLDTPQHVCMERHPEGQQFDEKKWYRVQEVRERLVAVGERCHIIDNENAYEEVITLLQVIGGWDPFSTPPFMSSTTRTRYTLEQINIDILGGHFPNGDNARIRRLQDEWIKHREKFPA